MSYRILTLVCLFATLGTGAAAQTSSGTINGTVRHPSGASVAGAKVRLLGTDTGDIVRELVSGTDAGFVAPLLRPSTYTGRGYGGWIQDADTERHRLAGGRCTEPADDAGGGLDDGFGHGECERGTRRGEVEHCGSGDRRQDHSAVAAERTELSAAGKPVRRRRAEHTIARPVVFGLRESRAAERVSPRRSAQSKLPPRTGQPRSRCDAPLAGGDLRV